jgi:hypothetical protein
VRTTGRPAGRARARRGRDAGQTGRAAGQRHSVWRRARQGVRRHREAAPARATNRPIAGAVGHASAASDAAPRSAETVQQRTGHPSRSSAAGPLRGNGDDGRLCGQRVVPRHHTVATELWAPGSAACCLIARWPGTRSRHRREVA